MAERKIQTGKSGLYSIGGKHNVELNLEHNDHAKHHVVEKDMPTNLPTTWNGTKITWFTCFGVRHKKDDGSDGDFADVEYSIQMDALSADKTLLTFYDGAIHVLKTETAGGKTKARLNRGDPPVGHIP
jgi:hypothetical protein